MSRGGERPDKPLERYLRILEVAAAYPLGVTLAELVEILELPKTTAHRLLGGLLESGALIASRERQGAFVLGPRLLGLLYVGTPDEWLEPLSRPLLTDLAERTGLSAFIGKLSGRHLRAVASAAPSTATVLGYVMPGRELWLHAAASGKAVLAFQPPGRVRQLVPSLPALTDRTVTDYKTLEEELARVRASGVATCEGEDVVGFGGIACPIHLPDLGVIYAVAVTGTNEMLFGARERDYVEALRDAAKRLSRAIGTRLIQMPAPRAAIA